MVKKANLQKLEDVTLKMKSHFAITVFLRNVFFFLFPLGIPNRWEVHTKWQVNVCSNPKVIKIMWYMIKSFRKVTKKKDFSIGFFWRLDQNFDIVYIWLQWLERLRLWTTGIRWETRVWRGTDVRKEKKERRMRWKRRQREGCEQHPEDQRERMRREVRGPICTNIWFRNMVL